MQWVGIATTSLIVGLIPLLISWHALVNGDSPNTWANIGGIACAAGALLTWSWYAVSNARQLARITRVYSHDWALVTGVVTGAQSLVLAVPVLGLQAETPAPANGCILYR